MTLELNQITGPVRAMAVTLERQMLEREERLKELTELLHRHAQPDDLLLAKVEAAKRAGWIGAAPREGEPLDVAVPALPLLPNTVIIAADGSQIHPDRHASAMYYIVNVGSIVFCADSGEAPETHSVSHLGYDSDSGEKDRDGDESDLDQLDTDEQPLTAARVDDQRDLAEVKALAIHGEEERLRAGGDLAVPIVALADGTLLLLRSLYEQTGPKQEKLVEAHAAELHRLQKARVAAASYIDRPGSALVMRLLRLAESEKPPDQLQRREDIPMPTRNDSTDRSLFRFLRPGERSALFYNTSRINDQYEGAGQRIAFFYMNVGGAGTGEIGRVEVPHWLADAPSLLGWVQAALYDQAQVTGGYPYVLARAHELAVITWEEKAEVERIVQTAMATHGLNWTPSMKAYNKQLTGSRGRRRR